MQMQFDLTYHTSMNLEDVEMLTPLELVAYHGYLVDQKKREKEAAEEAAAKARVKR